MSDELIPCPFCGSDDIETFYNRSGVDHYTCQYCGATAKQWNTRHEPDELPKWAIKEINTMKDWAMPNPEYGFGFGDACDRILSLRKPENK